MSEEQDSGACSKQIIVAGVTAASAFPVAAPKWYSLPPLHVRQHVFKCSIPLPIQNLLLLSPVGHQRRLPTPTPLIRAPGYDFTISNVNCVTPMSAVLLNARLSAVDGRLS